MPDYRVILAIPSGQLSGVDVFSCNLVRGLQESGIPAHVLLTEPYRIAPALLPLAADVPTRRLAVSQHMSWQARWRVMIRYLEDQAPCIYIPNYDWRHSCVSPVLSDRVAIAGIVHSDDPQHYEHVTRLGRYWNAIVAVSPAIARQVTALDPTLAPRLHVIPYGVDAPERPPAKNSAEDAPLRIVYAGRLVQEQKRVMDLARIAEALAERQVPFELTIVGGGAEQTGLLDACAPLLIDRRVRFLGTLANAHVRQVFADSDVVILTSEYEGLPVSLLEAMAQGCVPVVTDIRSGIPELMQEGVNGFRVPVGDVAAFCERLALLQRDAVRRQEMGSAAHRTIIDGGYRTKDMVTRYVELFEQVWRDAAFGAYRRPRGHIVPPPALASEAGWKAALPVPVRRLGTWGKRTLAPLREIVRRGPQGSPP